MRLLDFFKPVAQWGSAVLKSAAITLGGDPSLVYGGYGMPGGLNGLRLFLPSTRLDYRQEAGPPQQNAIVMSCVLWLIRTFPEAPCRVVDLTGGKQVPLPSHPMIAKIRKPNPWYNGTKLWQATVASYNLVGNAYWILVFNDLDPDPVEIWWEPHETIRPVIDPESSNFIEGYQLMRHGEWMDRLIPVEHVIHFRLGLDPDNPRLGISPLASLSREIFTDNEAANYTASLLRNLGVPGVVISPKTNDFSIEEEDAEGMKRNFLAKFSGDRRGEPLIQTGPTDVTVISWSPEQMNLDRLRSVPEERITAALGIPAVVAGMGAGLDKATYNNVSEAKASAYENNLIPCHRSFAEELVDKLLPFYGEVDGLDVQFDRSNVLALREDMDAIYSRVIAAFQGDLLKRAEARGLLGQDLMSDTNEAGDGEDDVYFSEIKSEQQVKLADAQNQGQVQLMRSQDNMSLPGPLNHGVNNNRNGEHGSGNGTTWTAIGKSVLFPKTREGKIAVDDAQEAFGELLDELEHHAAAGD